MHLLNVCGKLCLPKNFKGRYECFGLDIIHEFPEAVIVPMAGIATMLHILYISRPIMRKRGKSSILRTEDFDTKDKIESIFRDKNAFAAAPDHALDPSPLAELVFENREKSLKTIVEKLLNADYKKVAVWANNGIGKTASDYGKEDGVLKDRYGHVRGTRLNGKEKPTYQRGMPDTYQNAGHAHIHIAPVTEDNRFDIALLRKLRDTHRTAKGMSLMDYREYARTQHGAKPCIAVCIVDADKYDSEKPLVFEFYAASEKIQQDDDKPMSGLVRETVLDFTRLSLNIDLGHDEVKKQYTNMTKEYYKWLLAD